MPKRGTRSRSPPGVTPEDDLIRRILANLLAEDDLAGRRRTLPPRTVLETVARMAPLLRVFAREGDRLWSPALVGPGHVHPRRSYRPLQF